MIIVQILSILDYLQFLHPLGPIINKKLFLSGKVSTNNDNLCIAMDVLNFKLMYKQTKSYVFVQ